MIMIWNRKEVFVGNSIKQFGEVRDILSVNKIKYKYSVSSNNDSFFGASSRDRMGSLGVNQEYSKMFYVYVHKDDYDNACYQLHNKR